MADDIPCHLCGTATKPYNAICRLCRKQLQADGKAWCGTGKHVVAASDIRQKGRCQACDNDRLRSRVDVCATCNEPIATHRRCQGCTRLLHSDDTLCPGCARDRARGVPPKGFPMSGYR